MKIIYHCFGGAHSSVTAAALHLGMLNKTRPPTKEQLMEIPYYDKTSDVDFGSIRYMGTDEFGHEVYVLGKKSMGNRYSAILMGVAEIVGKQDQLIVVNCMDRVNWSMKIGGFTSRRMRLVLLGRPVVTWGTQKAFSQLVNLVEITRLKAMRHDFKVQAT
ncbi:MAG: hypothetical protein CVU90_09270 [Firmicutes bacterium HGW-Firmicutes-15]|nr:MAG: hypothetical protein CVU90_09270 [Firmicutes bacterium HGW-Firmicutes-15]